MKIIAWIAVFVLLGTAVVWWRVTHIRPQVAAPRAELVIRGSDGGVTHLSPDSATATSIQSWLTQHQSGWRPSFITYASHVTFSTDTFRIDVIGDFIVLNYSEKGVWRQITRRLSPDERMFWEHLSGRSKPPSQAMRRIAGCSDA